VLAEHHDDSAKHTPAFLYIGNLAAGVTEDELKDVCGSYGQVLSVNMMTDAYIGSQQPRVYAYVEMAFKSQCAAVVHGLDGKLLGKRALSVVEALPLSHVKGGSQHSKYRQR
jgi:RNA recognition motif-containing protein